MAEVTLKVFHISYSRKMDSKQKKHRHFRAQSVFVSFHPQLLLCWLSDRNGATVLWTKSKPHQACRCVYGKGEGTEQRKHHSPSFWEDFSFPKCGSTRPWCTQGVSHPLVLPLPLSFPDHMVIDGKREQGILLALQFKPVSQTLYTRVAQSSGTAELSQPRHGCACAPTGSSLPGPGSLCPEELSALIPCIFKGSNSSTWQKQNQCSVVLPLSFYQQVTLSWIKKGLVMKNSHFCSAASNCSSH